VVARLVLDVLWRNRWVYVVVSAILVQCWLMYVASGVNVLEISMMALSLLFAAVLGPMFTIATMGVRELRHLPVTSRDLWRTTWIVATVLPAGVLLATKMVSVLLVVAFGGSPKASAGAILLSALYDFTYAGTLLPVFSLLGYAGYFVARSGALAASLPAAGAVVAVLTGFVLPIPLSAALPTQVSEFNAATTGLLIACLAIAFGALAWTPPRGVLPAFAPKALRRGSPELQRRRADRLTGISRVVVPHLLATLALPAGACLALASYGVITGSGPWWFVPQAPTVFDPADTGDRGLTYFVLLPCLVMMQGLWTPWARLLKVLPLSVRQINALLLFTPFATWTILWLLGWSAYVFAYGTPRILRVEFAFGMAAITALAHAAQLRVQGGTGSFWIVVAIGALTPQVVKAGLHDGTVAQVVFAVIGAMALCAAAFVNQRTLTLSSSSSRAYRRPQPPFGFPAKHSLQ
jgi:hypothetical protein